MNAVSSTQKAFGIADSLVRKGEPWSVDTSSANLYDKPRAHVDRVFGLRFLHGGRTLLSVSATEAHLWDVPSRKQIAIIHPGDRRFTSVDVSPDRRWLALAKGRGRTELWALPPP